MSDEKKFNKLGDIVVEIIGPILIMFMVGSLAFFLIEVALESDQHKQLLKWKFGLFTFAAVLISRISIQMGFERASVYGFLLALAILFVSSYYISFFSAAVIVGVIWWSAGRLTWDCTFIGDTRDTSAQGIIELAGRKLRQLKNRLTGESGDTVNENEYVDPVEVEQRQQAAENAVEEEPYKKILSFFFGRRYPNMPGLWVFYFVIGGLVIFGLGQGMIDGNNRLGRNYAPMYFAVYMISALGLLMMSSLLGLSRYLKKRHATMNMDVATSWIAMGTFLAIGVLLFTFWMPRPSRDMSIAGWIPKVKSKIRETSDNWFSMKGSDPSTKDPTVNAGADSRDPEQNRNGGDQKKGGGQKEGGAKGDRETSNSQQGGKSNQSGGKQSGGNHKTGQDDGKGKSGQSGGKKSGKSSGNQKSESKNKHSSDQGNQEKEKSENSKQQQKNSGQEDKDNKNGQKKQNNDESSSEQSKQEQDRKKAAERNMNAGGKKRNQKTQSENQNNKQQKKQTGGSRRNQPETRSNDPEQKKQRAERQQQNEENRRKAVEQSEQQQKQRQQSQSSIFSMLGTLLKFIFWLVLLIAGIFLFIKYRQEIAKAWKNFVEDWKKFWANLFGRKSDEIQESAVRSRTAKPVVRSFVEFTDPFSSSKGKTMSPEEIVEYTFGALEAWGNDNQCSRDADETAHEFAKRLSNDCPAIKQNATQLANLYSQIAYAQGTLSREDIEPLKQLWELMRTTRITRPPDYLAPSPA